MGTDRAENQVGQKSLIFGWPTACFIRIHRHYFGVKSSFTMGNLGAWKRWNLGWARCCAGKGLQLSTSSPPAICRGTCTRRDPRTLTRPSRPAGRPILRAGSSLVGGTFFSSSRFVTIRCPFLRPSLNSIRRVLATCLRRRHRHPHRHRRRSFHLHFSKPPPPGYPPPSSSYSILTLYLPTTCLGPSFRPTSAIQSVASSSSSEQVSSQTRATRSVCPEPSHRLHLPDSSACGRVA